jgi:hypothetical protein
MNTNIMKKIGRRGSVLYYDVTNFYYEIDEADEDELDEEGNVLAKGMRKYGVSKEERKQAIALPPPVPACPAGANGFVHGRARYTNSDRSVSGQHT